MPKAYKRTEMFSRVQAHYIHKCLFTRNRQSAYLKQNLSFFPKCAITVKGQHRTYRTASRKRMVTNFT